MFYDDLFLTKKHLKISFTVIVLFQPGVRVQTWQGMILKIWKNSARQFKWIRTSSTWSVLGGSLLCWKRRLPLPRQTDNLGNLDEEGQKPQQLVALLGNGKKAAF